MATVGEMLADDAKRHWPGTDRHAGDFEGKEAILAICAEPLPEGMSWQSELHAVLADDDHTVALIKNTVVRDGETIQNDVVQVFHIANGKVTEAWGMPVDHAAFEAVEVWFDRVQTRLEHGQECAASRALGIMAHLLGDVAQPMHTDSRPAEDRVHGAYEAAVDSRSEPGDGGLNPVPVAVRGRRRSGCVHGGPRVPPGGRVREGSLCRLPPRLR